MDTIIVQAEGEGQEPVVEEAVAEVAAEAVVAESEAAVEIASIQADAAVAIEEIHAEARVEEAEAFAEAAASDGELVECRKSIEALETRVTELSEQVTLLTLPLLTQPEPDQSPSNPESESPEVMPDSHAAVQEPEPPAKPRKSRWI